MHGPLGDTPDLSRPDPASTGPAGGLSARDERLLIEAAVAAPSVHNTQPWRFTIGGPHIDLLADPGRQLTLQDPEGRALVISCGAALLNLRVAAEHLGYDPQVRLLPDPADPQLLATIDLDGRNRHAGMSGVMYSAIERRHTNRNPYENRPVPASVLTALVEAARQEGADLLPVTDLEERRRLVELVHEADLEKDEDDRFLLEASQWTGVGADRADGVPSSALGPIPTSPETPHRDLARGRSMPGRHFARFEPAPTLAVLTTPRDDRRSWLVAGQALERVLLVATVEGLASTFVNQPLEMDDLRWLVRQPDSGIAFPQMIMRIGYAMPVPPTPRRPIDEVVEHRSGR